jgi:hypothetical protein
MIFFMSRSIYKLHQHNGGLLRWLGPRHGHHQRDSQTRFLVALADVRDLLLRAKYLFVAAILAGRPAGGSRELMKEAKGLK